MLGCEYKVMDRFYVMVGETFQGIVREPVFVETTADGKVLSRKAERLDGWYLGVPTGRRWRFDATPGRATPLLAFLAAVGTALVLKAL